MNIEEIPLQAESLMNAACVETGMDDFGSLEFVEPLKNFLQSVVAEAGLGAPGLIGLRMDLLRLLTNRLRMHDDIVRHPEILEEEVSDPIVITGLPRTGTTKLQRMLAQDPSFQNLALWRALNPAPPPGSRPDDPTARVAMAKGMTDLMAQMFPGFLAAHPMQPEEAEEEVLLLQMSFETPANAWFFRAPSHLSWLMQRPQLRPYEELRTALQYLQWQDGGRRGRPWLLKSPIHLGELQHLFAVFPGAVAVHCHRDPAAAIPSLSGFIEILRQSRGHEHIDPLELGQFFLEFGSEMWERNLQQRKNLPSGAKIIDVHFDQIRSDAAAVIREIYRTLGRTLDQQTLDGMRLWEQQNPQDRFGTHRYSMERFGLTAESIENRFQGYLERFPAQRRASAR